MGGIAQCKQHPEPGWCNKPASSFSLHTNKCPPNFVTEGFFREDPAVGPSGTSLLSSGTSNSRNPNLEFQQVATGFRLSQITLPIICITCGTLSILLSLVNSVFICFISLIAVHFSFSTLLSSSMPSATPHYRITEC